jgi:hypothetical protein
MFAVAASLLKWEEWEKMGIENAKIHADDLQNARLQVIFYFTLLVTMVQAGYIVWDAVTMLPGAVRFFGLAGPNSHYASGYMTSLYLTLLAAYGGYKEYIRWTNSDNASETEVPLQQVIRFKRGEVIVTFWVSLYVLSIVLLQQGLISRLPFEIQATAVGSLGILIGTWASKDKLSSRRKKTAIHSAHSQKVLAYVDTNKYIENEACQTLTGLGADQVYRLLKRLEADGELGSEGTKRGRRYFRLK